MQAVCKHRATVTSSVNLTSNYWGGWVRSSYPYGKLITALGESRSYAPNAYKYNEKQLIDDPDLQWYDYGARMLDGLRWDVPDPLAELRPWESPYSFSGNNPINRIDPDGLYWYSWEEDEYDEEGNKKTVTKYQYHEQRLSRSEMKEKGYTKDLGLVHFSKDTYFRLEGGTTSTSDFEGTIDAMAEDFGKMSYNDANRNMSKAEAFLSEIGWNEGMPTTIDLGTNRFVVPSQKEGYMNVNNRELYYQFGSYLKSQGKSLKGHPISTSFSGTNLMLLEPLIVPGIPTLNYETKKLGDRRKDEQRIRYYRQAGIIR